MIIQKSHNFLHLFVWLMLFSNNLKFQWHNNNSISYSRNKSFSVGRLAVFREGWLIFINCYIIHMACASWCVSVSRYRIKYSDKNKHCLSLETIRQQKVLKSLVYSFIKAMITFFSKYICRTLKLKSWHSVAFTFLNCIFNWLLNVVYSFRL